MKIIINNICYVETTDTKFLKLLKIFNLEEKPLLYDSSIGIFEKYELNDSIIFFANNKYVLNYDKIKNLEIGEIDHLILSYELKLIELFRKQTYLKKENKEEKIKLEFEIMQLKHLIDNIKKYKEYKLTYDTEIKYLTKQEIPKTYKFKLKK